MTIFSWNVNGIRSVERKGFIPWLLASGADVACIQETKARPEQLSPPLRSPASGAVSYQSFWASAEKPGYSGTALYSRLPPDRVNTLGVPRFDAEGRVLAAHYGGTVVVSAYFPNSQEGGARLPYKLDFCAAMLDFCAALVSGGKHVVLCGDYNIAHKPIDLKNPKANEGNPGYLPEERAWLDSFVAAGFADTFRHFCAEGDQYTWWSYRARAREKNVGWRIDYQCVDEAFLPSVASSEICASVPGSDHCPICLTTR
jgi:exodeoxyribonuclease-3